MDRIGRRRLMVASSLPYIAGWLLTAVAPVPPAHAARAALPTLASLFAGRLLLGFGGGGCMARSISSHRVYHVAAQSARARLTACMLTMDAPVCRHDDSRNRTLDHGVSAGAAAWRLRYSVSNPCRLRDCGAPHHRPIAALARLHLFAGERIALGRGGGR